MRKTFLPLLAAILLIGAGCNGQNAPAPSGAPETNQNTAANSDPCATLKTASGGPLLTPPDAAAVLGGTWSESGTFNTDVGCGFTLASDENPNAETRFRFVTLTIVEPYVYDGVLKTKRGEGNTNNYLGYRDVPGLGDEAFFQWPNDNTRALNTLLYIKKGNRVIAVGSRGASEDQILKLGQTATSRW